MGCSPVVDSRSGRLRYDPVPCRRRANTSPCRSPAARSRSRIRPRCSFRRPGSPSSISCATTSPSPTARCAAPAAGRTCWCAIRTASTASSSTRSARRASRPPWIEVVTLRFPSGRTAEEVVPRDAAALAWMANLACLELHPHPVRADDLDHPDELRVDLDPVPGVEWPQIREVAGVVRAALRRLRPRRLAEDVGLARHARLRAHRAALDVRRGAPRRARARARGRAARARARDQQVVEGRAPRRLPRLQPEREGSHGRERLLGAADARRARLGAAHLGRARRVRPEDFTLRTMPARFARLGDRHAGIDAQPVLARRAARAVGARRSARASATRRGRRTTRSRPASRRACSRRDAATRRAERPARSTNPLIEIGRAREEGRRARRARALEGAPPRRRMRTSQPADVLVDAMRGRFTTWTRIRVNLQHVPAALRPGAGAARSRRRPGIAGPVSAGGARAEDLLELVRGRDLELIVAAVRRRLVGPPAQEGRRVAEAIALQVVVLHLADALDPQRLPREILARAPAALAAGHALAARPSRSPTRATDGRRARPSRSGASSAASCARVAIVNDDVTPT